MVRLVNNKSKCKLNCFSSIKTRTESKLIGYNVTTALDKTKPIYGTKEVETGLVAVETQNHSFAVDAESLKKTELEITHINILDNSVEGVSCKKDKVYSVQFYPGSEKGPKDSDSFFDKFVNAMKEGKANA